MELNSWQQIKEMTNNLYLHAIRFYNIFVSAINEHKCKGVANIRKATLYIESEYHLRGIAVGAFRLQLKFDGTRWRTGGEVKGKLANGVGSQYPSHYLGT